MSTITYHCGICKTVADSQKSHHTKHLKTKKHIDKKRIKELELNNLSADELQRTYNSTDINVILKNLETVQGEIIVGCDQPIICNKVVETKKYKPINNTIWSIQDNQDENTENQAITNALKSTINACHSKLYSANSIVGTKAQNDIMRILCIKLLEEQFNDENSEIYKKCLEQKSNFTDEDDYNLCISYCQNLSNLIKKEDVFEEWEFLVNNFMVNILPSIYDEQDSKFNCSTINCIVNIIKDINKLEINQAFKDSFSTACGDIHEAFRAYGGGKGAKELGQFFTPRHLIHLMFHSLGLDNLLKEDMSTYDPCMGTGGFLTRIFKLANIESKNIYGCETELDTIKFGYMSLYLTTQKCEHNIKKCNSLCENDFIQTKKFDSIITNPPFGTKMNYKDLQKTYNDKYPTSDIKFSDIYPLKVNNGACLFIQHCVFMLNKNGFCAIVLPDGELFEGNSKWSKTFRKWWCTNVNILTILKVASGTFEHTDVKTNVVIFTNDGPTQNIKFMETSKDCNEVKELFTITKNDLQSTEYSLDVGEYLEETNENYNCPMVALGDIMTFLPKSKKKASYGKLTGQYPFYTSSQKCTKYCDEYDHQDKCLILGTGGTANIKYDKQFSCSTDNLIIKLSDSINHDYVYYYLWFNMNLLENGFKGQCIKHISSDYVKKLKIPLPSTEIQQEIVNELLKVDDSIKTIDTRVKQLKIEKEQYKKYAKKAEIRGLLGDCEKVALGDICEININNITKDDTFNIIKYIDLSSIKNGQITDIKEINYMDKPSRACRKVCIGDVLFGGTRPNLQNHAIVNESIWSENLIASTAFIVLSPKTTISSKYLYFQLMTNEMTTLIMSKTKSDPPAINQNNATKLKIALPSTEIQQQCITIFEQKEQYLNQLDEKINKEKEYIKELKSLGKHIIATFCG